MRRIAWVCMFAFAIIRPVQVRAQVKGDEVVVFFPTFAHLAEDEMTWVVPIHGWVYEPETDSLTRAAALGLFRRALGLDEAAAGTALFEERARLFLVDNQRLRKVSIRLLGKEYYVGRSVPSGHFAGELRIADKAIRDALRSKETANHWVPYEAVARKGDRRTFSGQVRFLSGRGVSVISDIDDTIKISQSWDPELLFDNTFLKEFEAVPGMAEVYRRWEAAGASFHYVSASPWQLCEPLSDLLRRSGFPLGSFHLMSFRWKDASVLNLFSSPEKTKFEAIEPILQTFPGREFVLVGDSAQRDPEIYGDAARRHPDRAMRIFIRNVTNERADSERFTKAFEGIPKDRWKLFTDPAEIGDY